AYLIDDGDGEAILLCHVAEHFLPQGLLAGVEGRGGEVKDGLRAGFGEGFDRVLMITAALPEIAVVPDVFADADAKSYAVQLQNLGAVEGLEVAVLVEHVVCGEEGLVEG